MGNRSTNVLSSRHDCMLIGVVLWAMLVVLAGCESKPDSTPDACAEAERILHEEALKFQSGDPELLQLTKKLVALGDVGMKSASDALDARSTSTGALAVSTLVEFGEPGRNVLISAMSSTNKIIKYRAIRGLGNARDVRALPELLKMVDTWSMKHRVVGRALIKIGQPAVPGLLKLLESSKRDVRRGAAELLGEIADNRAIQPLADLLGDKEFFVRCAAGRALAKYGTRVIPTLARLLKNSNNKARSEAATILGEMDDTRAAVALVSALDSTPDSYITSNIINALVKLGSKSIDPLLPILKKNGRKRIRNAMEALSRIPDPRVVAPLLEAQDKLGNTVWDVVDKLAKRPKVVEKPAMSLLHSNAPLKVRVKAIRLLGLIKSKSAVKPLCQLIRTPSKDSAMRNLQRKAIWALGQIGDRRAIPAIKLALDWSPRGYYKTAAIRSLGQLNAQEMVGRFIEELDANPRWGSQFHVGQTLLSALGNLRAVKAIPAIKRQIENNRNFVEVVNSAVNALEKIGDPEVLSVFESLATHKDGRIRSEAIRAMGKFAKPSSIKTLRAAMKYNDTMTYLTIAFVCSKIGTPDAIKLLRKVSTEGDFLVRERAMKLLVKKDPEAVAFLIRRYPNESHLPTRSTMIKLLKSQKAVEALPIFLAAAKDSSPDARCVRSNAFWGLAAVGNSETVRLLEKYKAETEAEMKRDRNSMTISVFACARDALVSLKNRLRKDKEAQVKKKPGIE